MSQQDNARNLCDGRGIREVQVMKGTTTVQDLYLDFPVIASAAGASGIRFLLSSPVPTVVVTETPPVNTLKAMMADRTKRVELPAKPNPGGYSWIKLHNELLGGYKIAVPQTEHHQVSHLFEAVARAVHSFSIAPPSKMFQRPSFVTRGATLQSNRGTKPGRHRWNRSIWGTSPRRLRKR